MGLCVSERRRFAVPGNLHPQEKTSALQFSGNLRKNCKKTATNLQCSLFCCCFAGSVEKLQQICTAGTHKSAPAYFCRSSSRSCRREKKLQAPFPRHDAYGLSDKRISVWPAGAFSLYTTLCSDPLALPALNTTVRGLNVRPCIGARKYAAPALRPADRLYGSVSSGHFCSLGGKLSSGLCPSVHFSSTRHLGDLLIWV
jgi:hypothetical protein